MTDDAHWLQRRIRPRTLLLLVLVVVVAAPSLVFAASFLDDSTTVDGSVALNSTDGPQLNVTGLNNDEINLTDPFPDSHTVELRSEHGNLTISGDTQVSANVSASEINGTWTNVTQMGDASANFTIEPEGKQKINISDATNISLKDITLSDGEIDFVIGSAGTSANITIFGFNSTTDGVVAFNASSGARIDQDDTTDGSATLEISTSTTSVTLNATSNSVPQLSNPQPEGVQTGFPTELSVDVDDDDFTSDDVTVEFEMNGTDVGSQTVSSAQTVTVTSGDPGIGSHTVNVTATDSYGNIQTLNYTFKTPANLTIRNASQPHEILDNREINVTFFKGDSIIDRTTTTGNVSLNNLSDTENIIISLEDMSGGPDEFLTVENLVIDVSEQRTVYMVHSNLTTRTVRFELDDQIGGEFENNNASVIVEKPINRSSFDNPKWETVFADEFGPKGATAELEDGQRYRVRVRNEEGNERVLGKYSADADETVTLEVGDVTVTPGDGTRAWAYNITWDDSGATTFIRFEYNDSEQLTDNLYLEIHELGNESNVLVSNTSFGGPHGKFSFSEPVTGDDANTTWVVDVVVDRDGRNIQIREPVGDNNPQLQQLSDRMQILISIGVILVVAGLFSRVNGHIGGIVIAGLGGIFYWIGFLPAGIGVVLLAMVVAATIFLREREVSGI